MTSTVELYDKAIISRQPNFDERKTRSEFRKVIPNLNPHSPDDAIICSVDAAIQLT
jgi:hypothetical protein